MVANNSPAKKRPLMVPVSALLIPLFHQNTGKNNGSVDSVHHAESFDQTRKHDQLHRCEVSPGDSGEFPGLLKSGLKNQLGDHRPGGRHRQVS
jgi:hypothetical protein